MNITSDAGDSHHNGGEKGGGFVYVSAHNYIFYPSTVTKQATNLSCVMRTRIGTNESSFTFYLVGLEIDGGSDHNHNHVRNQIALFGLFSLGHMDKLNVTCVCSGISFLDTAERDMNFLNLGIYSLVLKSNVQVGDELLIDEVIVKASLMKSVRAAVQGYDTELPLAIAVLEHYLGRNISVAAITSTDEPVVITEGGYDKEEIQEASKSVEIKDIVEVGHQTDSSGSTSPTITERIRKFFPGMGWFGGDIDGIRQDGDGSVYDILFKDVDTEYLAPVQTL